MEDDALLTIQDVAMRYGVHADTIDSLLKRNLIPRPVEGWPGKNRRWLQSEIVKHIRAMRKEELAEQVH